MKKVQIIKNMAEKLKFKEGVTPKEFVKFLKNVGVVYDQNYVKQIRYYMFDISYKAYGHYLECLGDLFEKAEPYKNMKGNEVLGKYTLNVFYCEECNVFVYDYEDYDFERVKIYCCKAPKWFKAGWEGMKKDSLTKDEFIDYYKQLNENSCFDEVGINVYGRDLSKMSYLELDYFKKKIDKYTKNVA